MWFVCKVFFFFFFAREMRCRWAVDFTSKNRWVNLERPNKSLWGFLIFFNFCYFVQVCVCILEQRYLILFDPEHLQKLKVISSQQHLQLQQSLLQHQWVSFYGGQTVLPCWNRFFFPSFWGWLKSVEKWGSIRVCQLQGKQKMIMKDLIQLLCTE